MTGDIRGDTAKVDRPESAHVKAPAAQDKRRENDTTHYTLFLAQACIKMFWSSLYAIRTQEMTPDDENIFWYLRAVLFVAEAVVQLAFLTNIFDRRAEQTSEGPSISRAGCGVAVVLAYNLYILPFAASITDVFRVVSWVPFVFNFGCLVANELGPFRKCTKALAAAHRD
ncbi:hypothetical protein DHEL01_v202061 [Diaporthe helianthi]|uniref:Transmembrane protein n=1 Tax=Diaporthe helianthi TaxID=158607 RepID=A0A2P5IAJ9_DIAHE|nr:hypothetical protein DHEL01_v202061 [Diaporthe helianthi]